MKRRDTVVCGFVLLLAVGLACPGCEGLRSARSPVEPQPARYSELETAAAQGKGMQAALDTHEEATTPRKAYEMFRRAIKDRDFEGCWRLVSSSTHEACGRQAAELRIRVMNNDPPPPLDLELLHIQGLARSEAAKLDGKGFFIGSLRRAAARDPEGFDLLTRTEYDHERASREGALVYVTLSGKRQEDPMRVVREGGVWRIEQTRPTASMR